MNELLVSECGLEDEVLTVTGRGKYQLNGISTQGRYQHKRQIDTGASSTRDDRITISPSADTKIGHIFLIQLAIGELQHTGGHMDRISPLLKLEGDWPPTTYVLSISTVCAYVESLHNIGDSRD
jgi:hypothetical protein